MQAIAELLTLIVAVMVIEDYAMIGAGLAVANADLHLGIALAGCILGLFAADMVFVAIGRGLGRSATQYPPLSWLIREQHLQACARFFQRYGTPAIIGSRFVPLLRTAMPFTVGLTEMSKRRTILCFLVASMIYCPVPIFLAMALGQVVQEHLKSYRQYGYLIAMAVLVVGWLSFRSGKAFLRWQSQRRTLLASEPIGPQPNETKQET